MSVSNGGTVNIQGVDGSGNPTNFIDATSNGLKVDGSAVTQPISGTVSIGSIPLPTDAATATLQTTGNTSLSNINGKLAALGQTTMSGSMPVTLASDQSALPLPQTRTASGSVSGLLGGSVTISCAGLGTVFGEVTGTWTGGIDFQGSVDGVTYDAISGTNIATLDGQIPNSTNVNGRWQFNVAGLSSFRFTHIGVGTGTAVINLGGTSSPSVMTSILGVSFFQEYNPVHTIVDSGTVAATQSGTWNVTNVSGTVSLPTGASTAARQDTGNTSLSSIDTKLTTTNSNLSTINTSVTGLQVTQGSTTSGQSGDLVQGAVTTSAPSYTTAKTNPLSLDTSGNLRVSVKDSPANTNKFLVTADPITFASAQAVTQSGTWTVQPGNTANSTAWLVTGTGGTFPVTDSGGSLTVDNGGTFAVQATVAAGATNIAKAEDDASANADVGVPAMAVRKGTPANTSGTDGDYEMLQMSAGRLWASSNIDQINGVTPLMGAGNTGTGSPRVTIASDQAAIPVSQSGTFTVQPGNTANTTPWLMTIYEGGRQVDVLPSSTPAVATDQALVVAVSPNNTVSVNNAQFNGVTTLMGNGTTGTGSQRVTIASDNTAFAVNATLQTGSAQIGHLEANQSVNNAQVNGSTIVASVTGVQDVMPRKRTGATGLSPNYSNNHITTKTTTTPTAATAYVSTIVISCSAAGTAWTLQIKDKAGTPIILIPAFTLAVPTTGLPIILQFAEPILMTSGIDIVTAGTTAGTVDVFITYWQ